MQRGPLLRWRAGMPLDDWTFSRSGTATYIDRADTIQTAAAGKARNGHWETDQVSGLWLPHLYLEGASTNLLSSPFSPATQVDVSLGNNTYTLSVKGTGSCNATGDIDGDYGDATEGSHLTFTPTATQNVDFTVTGSLDAFQCEQKGFPTSFVNGTRNAEAAMVPFSFDPQTMTVYVRFVERGNAASQSGALWQIGTGSTAPRLVCITNATGYRIIYFGTGGTAATGGLSSPPSVGDTAEVMVRLNSDGGVELHQSVNGAAATSQTAAAVDPIPSAWSAAEFHAGSTDGSNQASSAFGSILVMPGTGHSLTEMRGLAL